MAGGVKVDGGGLFAWSTGGIEGKLEGGGSGGDGGGYCDGTRC